MELIERYVTISNEALTVSLLADKHPPLPDTTLTAAQNKGRERYEGFAETPGRRPGAGLQACE